MPVSLPKRRMHPLGWKFGLALVLLVVAFSLVFSMTAFYYLGFSNVEKKSSSQIDTRVWMATQASRSLAAVPLADNVLRHRDSNSFEPFNNSNGVNVWDLFVPTLTCPELERVGFYGDGGKWVCGLDSLTKLLAAPAGDPAPPCVMYSFGISTDISFEMEILLRTPCSVFAFDPTIGSLPFHELPLGALRNAANDESFRQRITFHKIALGSRSGSSDKHALNEALPDIMARLGHSYVDLVKIDIEGGEWDVFKSLQQAQSSRVGENVDLFPFGQLFIELHYSQMNYLRNFFDFMTASGLVPFSREINLQPTLIGHLPEASEYSFINPARFFNLNGRAHASTIAPPVAVANAKARSGRKAVIYLLIQKSRINQLRKSLGSLYTNLWKQYRYYPVVLFHEKDVGSAEKRVIQAGVPKMSLTFATLRFSIPKSMRHPERIPNRTTCAPSSSTLGYRHMCRFHAHGVHRQLYKLGFTDLEYVMRLDDDSTITFPIGYDVFQFMEVNQLKYGFVSTVLDDTACVVGLWESARHFAENVSRFPLHNESFLADWPDPLVVYNNFEISHMSLWKSPLWLEFMSFIDELGGIYMSRWGDAPLHTIGVSMMLSKRDVHMFSDIGYRHSPFVNQIPRGLPKPHSEDPFSPEHCEYYGEWKCSRTNGTLSNGTFGNESLTVRRGVLYTFGFPGREHLLMVTLANFYSNYVSSFSAPVVVFYCKNSAFDARVLEASNTMSLEVHFVAVQLQVEDIGSYVDSSATWRASVEKCGAADPLARAASVFMRHDAAELLTSRGFGMHWRFFDDSMLLRNVGFDVFSFLEKKRKSFAYIESISGGLSECLDPLWHLADSICASHHCSPVFKTWSRTKIMITYFQISKASFTSHANCKALFDAAQSSGLFFSDDKLHTICAVMSIPKEKLWLIEEISYTSNWGSAGGITLPESFQKDYSRNDRTNTNLVTPLSRLDNLFSPERLGWLGGDVATSIPLPLKAGDLTSPPEKLVWLFGDTFIGVSQQNRRIKEHHAVIANSVGISYLAPVKNCSRDTSTFQQGSRIREIEKLKYFWRRRSSGEPSPIFEVANGACGQNMKESLWPISGIAVVSKKRTVSLVLVAVLACSHGGGLRENPLVFDVPHTAILVVHNPLAPPDEWHFDYKPLPKASFGTVKLVSLSESQGLAFASDLSTIYVLGTHESGVSDELTQVMLRVPASKLLNLQLDEFEIFGTSASKDRWHPLISSNKSPFLPQQLFNQAAVSEASLFWHEREWKVVSLHLLESRFQVCSAKEIHFPWKCVFIASLSDRWQRPGLITYAGKAHPHLIDESCSGTKKNVLGGLLVSFVANSILGPDALFEPENMHVYTPKFVEITKKPFAKS